MSDDQHKTDRELLLEALKKIKAIEKQVNTIFYAVARMEQKINKIDSKPG